MSLENGAPSRGTRHELAAPTNVTPSPHLDGAIPRTAAREGPVGTPSVVVGDRMLEIGDRVLGAGGARFRDAWIATRAA